MRDLFDVNRDHGMLAALLYASVQQHGRLPYMPSDLARRIDVPTGRVSGAIDSLLDHQLLQIEADAQGRWLVLGGTR